jgi:hypothetical protein
LGNNLLADFGGAGLGSKTVLDMNLNARAGRTSSIALISALLSRGTIDNFTRN